jgi:hypothetical protein
MVRSFLCLATPELTWLNSGFTITMYEFERTIETLWSTVLGTPTRLRVSLTELAKPLPLFSHADFITENPQYVAPNNAMNFLSDNGGTNYNLCHCTSMPSLLILPLKRNVKTNKLSLEQF